MLRRFELFLSGTKTEEVNHPAEIFTHTHTHIFKNSSDFILEGKDLLIQLIKSAKRPPLCGDMS